MKFVRLLCGTSALVALVAFVLVMANRPVHAYQDSPAAIARPGADITDAYIFPSPTNPIAPSEPEPLRPRR